MRFDSTSPEPDQHFNQDFSPLPVITCIQYLMLAMTWSSQLEMTWSSQLVFYSFLVHAAICGYDVVCNAIIKRWVLVYLHFHFLYFYLSRNFFTACKIRNRFFVYVRKILRVLLVQMTFFRDYLSRKGFWSLVALSVMSFILERSRTVEKTSIK